MQKSPHLNLSPNWGKRLALFLNPEQFRQAHVGQDHQQRVDLGPRAAPDSASYTETKHAVTGLTKSTSLDGREYNIACGQIGIGSAATDMTARMPSGTAQAGGSMKVEPTFDVEHVASEVVYLLGLPMDTNVQFVTIMATNMPYIGRG